MIDESHTICKMIHEGVTSHTMICEMIHERLTSHTMICQMILLDYCNTVFAGLPACDIWRLQSILNSSVRLVTATGARKYDHMTSLLHDRNWLLITKRIEYKNYTHSFIGVYRVMHHGTLNSAIVWRQSFFSRRPACLEQSLVKPTELARHLT